MVEGLEVEVEKSGGGIMVGVRQKERQKNVCDAALEMKVGEAAM
jgi:hypothetical protein